MLPLAVFFAAYAYVDIFFATAAAMIAVSIQVAWTWLKHKKVPAMLWVSFAAFMVFGGLTLFLRDQRFVMVKPTIVYWAMAIGFVVAYYGFAKNPIKLALQVQFDAPDVVWKRWMFGWIAFFVALGFLNLFVAYTFSEAIWVKFKVFGVISLSLLLSLVQVWRMMPYAKPDASTKL